MFSNVLKSGARAFTPMTRRVALAGTAAVGGGFMMGGTVFADSQNVDYGAVKKSIASILDQEKYDDGSIAPVLIRLAWHSSGTYSTVDKTGGSNGATMRFAPESKHGANAGLNIARDLLEPIKAKYPGISYADLYTLAGKVAVEEMGGPEIPWRSGRTDAADGKACTPDGRLPDAAQGAQHLRDIFYRMGFNDQEIVALAGAHSVGRCHTDRSGFDGPWTRAPTTFSNLYFIELLNDKNNWKVREWKGPKQYEDASKTLMMLPADLAIRDDPVFRKHAEAYAKDEAKFFKDFSAAFGKLMELGVEFKGGDSTPPVLIGSLIALALAKGASLPWQR